MSEKDNRKQTVLIADDSEMNRDILVEMLGDEFNLIQVENGREAVDVLYSKEAEISLLLLDLNMPVMDGFEVLAFMNEYRWIEDVPVIIISAEDSPAAIQRAYDFGVTDFISRPFDAAIVRRRVENTLLLSAKQKRLTSLVTDQIYEKEKSNRLMIAILAHIVEFRNGESGAHVVHISTLTELLLRKVNQKAPEYGLNEELISRIVLASTLHDIGKIAIPLEILNKPGRFTDEEYAIMKTHSKVGADMLDALPAGQKADPLVKSAYEICRWHHERYDGRGYPDGLKGEEIPISAQVVALADVYDALTAERVYKKAFSHETAIEMILGGQCGQFSPLLMECLRESADTLQKVLQSDSPMSREDVDVRRVADQLRSFDLTSSERQIEQAEFERERSQFFAETDRDLLFSYTASPAMLTFLGEGAKRLTMEKVVADPMNSQALQDHISPEDLKALEAAAENTTPEEPGFQMDLSFDGDHRYHCTGRTIWPLEGAEHFTGVVGRLTELL